VFNYGKDVIFSQGLGKELGYPALVQRHSRKKSFQLRVFYPHIHSPDED